MDELFESLLTKGRREQWTIYECFTGIGVNELRNMSWHKGAPPMDIRRLGSAKM